MPIYEYEPEDRECFMCDGRIEVMQAIGAEPCKLCPYCGLEVKKVVSNAAFKVARPQGADKASKKGFATFKKAETGVYEKVAGEGPDYIVGKKEDIAAVEAEKAPKPKVLKLDP